MIPAQQFPRKADCYTLNLLSVLDNITVKSGNCSYNSKMLQKNKLFSIKTSAGSRDYNFDIKVSVDGTKYLVIKEVREGFKIKQIIIFEEHLQTFYKNFRKSVKFMRSKKTKTYNIEHLRHDYPKAYAIWTRDEDNLLTKLYIHNKTIKKIAFICQRKPSAIRSRLKKLKKLGLF